MIVLTVESHFKDNPALSMLNDSDDDVVYGSVMYTLLTVNIQFDKYHNTLTFT